MKLNQVKFIPKTNAVADVYTEATGMPIIGELMAVAAGNGESNPFKNVVLNITDKYGDGNGRYVLTFNGNTDAEMSFTLYGENDFELSAGSFSPNTSTKYDTLFYDRVYNNIMEFPNGGTYEVLIIETEETYSGKWTLNDATANCENTEFPSVEDIQVEETEDGWVGRVTFDRDIRTYGDFYFEIGNGTLAIGDFCLESDLWDESQFEYLGNNTFQVSDFTVDNRQSGEFDDFTVTMNIGKFEECKSEQQDVVGTVTTLPHEEM